MAPLYPKYIQKYSNTAQLLGTFGMPCESIHSNDALEIEKCYFFGGYQGHRGANGVAKRTFRVYTGPKSAYLSLRQHEASLRSWIAEEEARMSGLWGQLLNYGKSGDRIHPRGSVMGSTRRKHKEKAARYAGYSYRRKEAKKALELQKSLNDALGSGAGLVTPHVLATPMAIPAGSSPSVLQKDLVWGGQSQDYESGGGQSQQDDYESQIADYERQIAEYEQQSSPVVPESIDYMEEDKIPAWMWVAGGAAALVGVHMITRKK